LAFPLVVDNCVLQPPIATSGETTYSLQVFPKRPVASACWCAVRTEPWVYPFSNNSISHNDSVTMVPSFYLYVRAVGWGNDKWL
jgi:hypothetical protein